MTTPIYTVYKITNTINDKIYIGVHKTTNPNDSYMGSGIHIKHAIRKFGKENFNKSILFKYDNHKDAYLKESQIVTPSFVNDKSNYNLIIGGGGINHIVSESSRQRMSESAKNKIFTKQHRENMSKSAKGMSGKSHSIKSKIQMVKSRRNNLLKNIKFYYITPWGKFPSTREASNNIISKQAVSFWCNHKNKTIITNHMIASSPYLKSLKESPLGKTFNDIGFDYY